MFLCMYVHIFVFNTSFNAFKKLLSDLVKFLCSRYYKKAPVPISCFHC